MLFFTHKSKLDSYLLKFCSSNKFFTSSINDLFELHINTSLVMPDTEEQHKDIFRDLGIYLRNL